MEVPGKYFVLMLQGFTKVKQGERRHMGTVESHTPYTLFRKRRCTAPVALITVFCFLFSSVAGDVVWAARMPAQFSGNGSGEDGGRPAFSEVKIKTFALPQYLGRVNETCPGDPDRTVIHIQDAHCNYAAQRRIGEILDYLNRTYGVGTVNLEGGAGGYDLAAFTGIGDPRQRERVADFFVREGMVNGAEFFAITRPDAVTLWGIEEPALYLENLKVYRDSLAYKDEAGKDLALLSRILNNLKRAIYPPGLFELDTKYSQYKANNLSFKDYLGYLTRTAREKGLETASLKNIVLLNKLLEDEGNIDFRAANRERDMLIDKLQKKIPKRELKNLVARTVEFKTGRISQKEFYGFLADRAAQAGLGLDDSPELRKFIAYVTTYDAIDKSKAIEEVEALEKALKESLFRNDTQRRLAILSKNLAIMKNIFNVSLTRKDYAYYLANRDDFAVRNYSAFIEKEAPVRGVEAPLDRSIERLDGYRERICAFYEYSLKRDEAFLDRVKFPVSGPKVAVIMTGGFHGENLCELFKKRGVTYISIMPSFTNEDGYACPYFKLLSGGRCAVMDVVLEKRSAMQVAAYLSGELGTKVYGPRSMDAFKDAVLIVDELFKTESKPLNVVLRDGRTVRLALDAASGLMIEDKGVSYSVPAGERTMSLAGRLDHATMKLPAATPDEQFRASLREQGVDLGKEQIYLGPIREVKVEGAPRTDKLPLFIDVSDDLETISYYDVDVDPNDERAMETLLAKIGSGQIKPFLTVRPKGSDGIMEDQYLLTPPRNAADYVRGLSSDPAKVDAMMDWDKNYGKRYVRFRNIVTSWDKDIDRGVWSTMIDTVHFHNLLQSILIDAQFGRHFTSAIELGCGGGHLSSLLSQVPGVQELYYTDVSPYALRVTKLHVDKNAGNRALHQHPYVGPGFAAIEGPEATGGKFDLVVSNPPYIPIPEFMRGKEAAGTPYGGTALIREMLQYAGRKLNEKNPDAQMLMIVSSLTETDLPEYIAEFGDQFFIEPVGEPMRVPLKIETMSDEWKEWFAQRGLIVKHDNAKARHMEPYSHTIQAYRIRLKSSQLQAHEAGNARAIVRERLRNLNGKRGPPLSISRDLDDALLKAFPKEDAREKFLRDFSGNAASGINFQIWHSLLSDMSGELALEEQIKLIALMIKLVEGHRADLKGKAVSLNVRAMATTLKEPSLLRAVRDMLQKYDVDTLESMLRESLAHDRDPGAPAPQDPNIRIIKYEFDPFRNTLTLSLGQSDYDTFYDRVLRPIMLAMDASGPLPTQWNLETFLRFYPQVKEFADKVGAELTEADIDYYAPITHDLGYFEPKKQAVKDKQGRLVLKSFKDQIYDEEDPLVGGYMTEDMAKCLTPAAQEKFARSKLATGKLDLYIKDIAKDKRVEFYAHFLKWLYAKKGMAIPSDDILKQKAAAILQGVGEDFRMYNSLLRPWEELWEEAKTKADPEAQRRDLRKRQKDGVVNALILARISSNRLPQSRDSFIAFMNKATHAIWRFTGSYVTDATGFQEKALVRLSYEELKADKKNGYAELIKVDEPLWRQIIRAKEMRTGITPDDTARRLHQIVNESKKDNARAGVALYVGAGISMESGLPDWYSLRNDVARNLMANTGASAEEIDYVTTILYQNWKISPERTMKTFYEDLGGRVLGAFGCLESGSPAENHLNIARLMNSGAVLNIVSLNFDTLIEQSCYLMGMWRVHSFAVDPATGKITSLKIAKYSVANMIEKVRDIGPDEIKDGTVDGSKLFFVNDENTLGPETLNQLTDRSVPVLHKVHGSSEKGREHTIIADFEGVDRAFPEPVRRNLIQMLISNAVLSAGVTWRDPDMSSLIAFLASLVKESDRTDLTGLSPEERSAVETMLQYKDRIKQGRGLVVEAFPKLIREQSNALQSAAKGSRTLDDIVAGVEAKADPVLEIWARLQSGSSERVRDAETKAKMLETARKEGKRVLEAWAANFTGKETARKQDVVYSIFKALQEADPSGKFEQEKLVFGTVTNWRTGEREGGDAALREKLKGRSPAEQRRIINDAYPLSAIFSARAKRYEALKGKGLLADWQYDYLMATLMRDQAQYKEAQDYYQSLVREKEDGAPLSTKPWLEKLTALLRDKGEAERYLSTLKGREEFMAAWRGQRLKMTAFGEMMKLHQIDSGLATPSDGQITEVMKALAAFADVFAMTKEVFDADDQRAAERLAASSEEVEAYLGIFRDLSGIDTLHGRLQKQKELSAESIANLEKIFDVDANGIKAPFDAYIKALAEYIRLASVPGTAADVLKKAKGAMNGSFQNLKHAYFTAKAEKFRTTGGKGGDLALLLDAYTVALHNFTESWNLDIAAQYLAKAESLAVLLNLPESHTLIRKLNTYKAYYLLLQSWNGMKGATDMMLGITSRNGNELLDDLGSLQDKDWWLMISDLVVQALWSKAEFRFTAETRSNYEQIMKNIMDWFAREDVNKLNDREVQSLFHVFTAYLDLKYLRGDVQNYEEIDPRILALTEKLYVLAKDRDKTEALKSIVPTNYYAMFAYYPHQKAVQTGDIAAYDEAVKSYRQALDAALKPAHKIRQALLLAQLNIDMAQREEALGRTDQAEGAMIAHRKARERFLREARAILKEVRTLSPGAIGDKRLDIKLARFEELAFTNLTDQDFDQLSWWYLTAPEITALQQGARDSVIQGQSTMDHTLVEMRLRSLVFAGSAQIPAAFAERAPITPGQWQALQDLRASVERSGLGDVVDAVVAFHDVGKAESLYGASDLSGLGLNPGNHARSSGRILRQRNRLAQMGFDAATAELIEVLIAEHGWSGQIMRGEFTYEVLQPVLDLCARYGTDAAKRKAIFDAYFLHNLLDMAAGRPGLLNEAMFSRYMAFYEMLLPVAMGQKSLDSLIGERSADARARYGQAPDLSVVTDRMIRLNGMNAAVRAMDPAAQAKLVTDALERVFGTDGAVRQRFIDMLSKMDRDAFEFWYPEAAMAALGVNETDIVANQVRVIYAAMLLSERHMGKAGEHHTTMQPLSQKTGGAANSAHAKDIGRALGAVTAKDIEKAVAAGETAIAIGPVALTFDKATGSVSVSEYVPVTQRSDDNIGKAHIAVKDLALTVTVRGEEIPLKTRQVTLSAERLERIRQSALGMNMARLFPGFIERLPQILGQGKVVVFTGFDKAGTDKARAEGALGHTEDGILYIDELLLESDLALIHEAIHAYLIETYGDTVDYFEQILDSEVGDTMIGDQTLRDKVNGKIDDFLRQSKDSLFAPNIKAALLRHYLARYYLQNMPGASYAGSVNEWLTNRIRQIIVSHKRPTGTSGFRNNYRSELTFANINLLGPCNQQCPWCIGNESDKFRKFDMLDKHFSQWNGFDRFLDELKEQGIKKVYLTGQNTEPLLYKYLPELIDHLEAKGFVVGIRTNGKAIRGAAARRHLEALQKLNGSVSFTVLSLNPETMAHYAADARDIDWRAHWDAVFRYFDGTNKKVRAAITVDEFNVKEVYETIKFLSKYKCIEYIQLRRVCNDTGRFKEAKEAFDELEHDIMNRTLNGEEGFEAEPAGSFELASQTKIYGKRVSLWNVYASSVDGMGYWPDEKGTVGYGCLEIEEYYKYQLRGLRRDSPELFAFLVAIANRMPFLPFGTDLRTVFTSPQEKEMLARLMRDYDFIREKDGALTMPSFVQNILVSPILTEAMIDKGIAKALREELQLADTGLKDNFDLPQDGVHHREGPRLRHHIQKMLDLLDAYRDGLPVADPEAYTPEEVSALAETLPVLKNLLKGNYALMRYAILLHDIAKKTHGRRHAEGVAAIMKDMKAISGEQRTMLAHLIEHHMEMIFADPADPAAFDAVMRSAYQKMGPEGFKLLMVFTLLDRQGTLRQADSGYLKSLTGNFNAIMSWAQRNGVFGGVSPGGRLDRATMKTPLHPIAAIVQDLQKLGRQFSGRHRIQPVLARAIALLNEKNLRAAWEELAQAEAITTRDYNIFGLTKFAMDSKDTPSLEELMKMLMEGRKDEFHRIMDQNRAAEAPMKYYYQFVKAVAKIRGDVAAAMEADGQSLLAPASESAIVEEAADIVRRYGGEPDRYDPYTIDDLRMMIQHEYENSGYALTPAILAHIDRVMDQLHVIGRKPILTEQADAKFDRLSTEQLDRDIDILERGGMGTLPSTRETETERIVDEAREDIGILLRMSQDDFVNKQIDDHQQSHLPVRQNITDLDVIHEIVRLGLAGSAFRGTRQQLEERLRYLFSDLTVENMMAMTTLTGDRLTMDLEGVYIIFSVPNTTDELLRGDSATMKLPGARQAAAPMEVIRNPLPKGRLIVTIDGLPATRKSTTARRLADELGIARLETGAFFRVLAYKLFTDLNGESLSPEELLAKVRALINDRARLDALLDPAETRIDVDVSPHKPMVVRLDGKEVPGEKLRDRRLEPILGEIRSQEAALRYIFQIVRTIGEKNDILVDGRNIGTSVFPDATVKFYMDLDFDERVEGRLKTARASRPETTRAEIESDLKKRDARNLDPSSLAPVMRPTGPNAVTIDTTGGMKGEPGKSLPDTVALMLKHIRERQAAAKPAGYTDEERKGLENEVKSLIDLLKSRTALSDKEEKDIRDIAAAVMDMHKEQRRKNGEPYFVHQLRVARMAIEKFGITNAVIIQIALLHDSREDQEELYDNFKSVFQKNMEFLTDSARKSAEKERFGFLRLGVRILSKLEGPKYKGLADALATYCEYLVNPRMAYNKEADGWYVAYDDEFVRQIQIVKLCDILYNTADMEPMFKPGSQPDEKTKAFPKKTFTKLRDYFLRIFVYSPDTKLTAQDKRIFYSGLVEALQMHTRVEHKEAAPLVKAANDALRDLTTNMADTRDADGRVKQITADGSALSNAGRNNNWEGWVEHLKLAGIEELEALYPDLFNGKPAAINIGLTQKQWADAQSALFGVKAAGNSLVVKHKIGNITINFFLDDKKGEGLKQVQDETAAIEKSESRVVTFAYTEVKNGEPVKDRFLELEKKCYHVVYMTGDSATPVSGCFMSGLAFLNHSYLEEQEKNNIPVSSEDKQRSLEQILRSISALSGGMTDEVRVGELIKKIQEQGYSLAAITFLVNIRPVDPNMIAEFHKSEAAVLRSL